MRPCLDAVNIALGVVLVALIAAGCSSYSEAPGMTGQFTGPDEHADTAPLQLRPRPVPMLRVVPPSDHVTGAYPRHCVARPGPRPDAGCTPGSVRSDVTQATIATTICVPGWTKTVRPPASETNRVKRLALAAYGLPAAPSTEFDHDVPLALGGSNDVSNLWPQTGPGPSTYNPKDHVEERLNDAVCEHRISLTAAQQAIASDWTTALPRTGVLP